MTVTALRITAPPTHCTRCGARYATRLEAESLPFGEPAEPAAMCWRLVSWRGTCAVDPEGALAWGEAQRRRADRARAALGEVIEAGGARPAAVLDLLEQRRAELAQHRAALDLIAARVGAPPGSPPRVVAAMIERAALSPRLRLALRAVEVTPGDVVGLVATMRQLDHRAAPRSRAHAARALRELERRGLVRAERSRDAGVLRITYRAAER